MVRHSASRVFLAVCWVSLPVGCSQQAPVPSQVVPAPRKVEAPKLTQDDFQIFDVVLVDLFGFNEFQPAIGGRKGKNEIVLYDKTAGVSFYLSKDQLRSESSQDTERMIPEELGDDLRKRNPIEVSLSEYKPSDPRITVGDLSGMSGYELAEKRPHTLGYVIAWLPGYAKDGQTAVFRATFGPTIRGATVTYLLAKKDGRWTVVWRTTSFYA